MIKKQENNKQLMALNAIQQSNITENSINFLYESTGLVLIATHLDCSENAKYIYTAVSDTNMYMSSDYGKNWSIMTVMSGYCFKISCDYSGKYVLARGKISRDYGVSTSTLANLCQFHAIAKRIPMYMYMTDATNTFYYSSDYGSTWSSITGKQFTSVTCSEDGKYVAVVCLSNAQIAISSNYGVSFTYIAIQSSNIRDVAMSASGQYIYVSYYQTNNISKSTDYGANFSTVASTSIGHGVSCSDDGKIVIMHNYTGTASYYSVDYGVTFSSFTLPYSSYYGNRFKNYLFFGATAGVLLKYISINSLNKIFGSLQLDDGSADLPALNFKSNQGTGFSIGRHGGIVHSIDGKVKKRIGKYGITIENIVDTFVNNVAKYPFEINVPNNNAITIYMNYMIVGTKSNVVKSHSGAAYLMARNQNGTVTTVINHMSSHETEFSPADVSDTFYFVANGTYAKFGYLADVSILTDGVDTGIIYVSFNVFGDELVEINYL